MLKINLDIYGFLDNWMSCYRHFGNMTQQNHEC